MKKLFTILVALHLMLLPVNKAHAIIGGMDQITGVAIAATGVSLLGSCILKPPSIMIYAAGAAAYLMGEMSAAKKHSEDTQKADDERKKLEESGIKGGELQKKALEAQIKQKEKDLQLANKRKMWTMAAAAIFTAAAAMAALEIPPFVPPTGCTASPIEWPLAAGVAGAYTFMTGGLKEGVMGALAGALVVSQGHKIAMNTNTGRSIAMGITAALVMASAMEAGKAASNLQDELKILKDNYAQFRLETDGTGPNTEDVTGGASSGTTSGEMAGTTSGAAGGIAGGATSGVGSGLTPLPDGEMAGGTTTCLNSSQQLSSNCSNPMTFSSPNLSMFGNQPDLLQVSNKATEFANSAASGNIGKANVAAANLSGLASKMKDLLKKNRAAANKKLIAQGKKPIDYDKETQDMIKSMQSSYQKETAGKQSQLAALGLDKMSLDPNEMDKSGQKIGGASTTAAVAVPTSDGKKADAVAPEDSTTAITAEAGKVAEESAASSLGKNLGEYETNDGDISAKKEDSLWKQVSNRYLLNYGRFFERNKLPSQ